MAGASAKKTAKNAQYMSGIYSGISLAASFINIVVRIAWFHSGYLESLFLSLVAFFSYRMIHSALELGVGYSLWQDLFIINTAVQLLSLWSPWFWILYLTVPGYAVCAFGSKLLTWIFTPKADEIGKEKQNKKMKAARR